MRLFGLLLPLEAKSAPTTSYEANNRLLTHSAETEGSGLADVIVLVTCCVSIKSRPCSVQRNPERNIWTSLNGYLFPRSSPTFAPLSFWPNGKWRKLPSRGRFHCGRWLGTNVSHISETSISSCSRGGGGRRGAHARLLRIRRLPRVHWPFCCPDAA